MSISSVNGVASTVSRYRFVAAGGETSLTGSDANGATLSYLVGKEEVYLNGALLVRGQDYTGTDGATISSLTALVAGDTVEIITFVPFAIPTAISSATVTTQGDLIVATGASAVTRLGVGSSGQILTSNGTTPAYTSTVTGTLNNGTLTGTLTAASSAGTSGQLLSSTGTGVQWVAAPAAGSLTLLSTTTVTSGTAISITSIPQTYKNLYVIINGLKWASGNDNLQFYPQNSVSSWVGTFTNGAGTTNVQGNTNGNYLDTAYTFDYSSGANLFSLFMYNYTDTTIQKPMIFTANDFTRQLAWNYGGAINTTAAITSMNIKTASGYAFTAGTVRIYGVN